MSRTIRKRSGTSVMTGLTFRAMGLYFFLRKTGPAAGLAGVDEIEVGVRLGIETGYIHGEGTGETELRGETEREKVLTIEIGRERGIEVESEVTIGEMELSGEETNCGVALAFRRSRVSVATLSTAGRPGAVSSSTLEKPRRRHHHGDGCRDAGLSEL